MKKAIGDIAAIEFAVAFYDALGAGESVEFAHKLACNAIIQLAGPPEHLTPVLKKQSNEPAAEGNGLAEAQRIIPESEQAQIDRLKEFVEVLNHRAQIILDYIEEQRRFAAADDPRNEARYESMRKRFVDLHKSYIDATHAGKDQLAHELIGNIYQLLYEARYEGQKQKMPPAYLR